MKNTLLMLTGISLFFAGCNQPPANNTREKKHKYRMSAMTNPSYSRYIPVDSANKMISSYLNSINYQQNDTDLRSLIFNADSLVAYLTTAKLANVKLMFAHTLDYINNGGQDQYAGYQSGALTLVVAGYDTSGNYVYYSYPGTNTKMVLENSMPCPINCPTSGTAANDLLQ